MLSRTHAVPAILIPCAGTTGRQCSVEVGLLPGGGGRDGFSGKDGAGQRM